MQILSVYGDNRSGKNYISEELSRRLHGDFVVYETSLPIRRLTDALHAHTDLAAAVATQDESTKDIQRLLLQQVSRAMHESFGPHIWIDLSLRDLEAQGRSQAILNGLRLPDGIDYVSNRLHGLNIWVEASRETIAQRYAEKGIELTDAMYNNQWDTQIRPYKDRMDCTIRNDGNLEETEADVRATIEMIAHYFTKKS